MEGEIAEDLALSQFGKVVADYSVDDYVEQFNSARNEARKAMA